MTDIDVDGLLNFIDADTDSAYETPQDNIEGDIDNRRIKRALRIKGYFQKHKLYTKWGLSERVRARVECDNIIQLLDSLENDKIQSIDMLYSNFVSECYWILGKEISYNIYLLKTRQYLKVDRLNTQLKFLKRVHKRIQLMIDSADDTGLIFIDKNVSKEYSLIDINRKLVQIINKGYTFKKLNRDISFTTKGISPSYEPEVYRDKKGKLCFILKGSLDLNPSGKYKQANYTYKVRKIRKIARGLVLTLNSDLSIDSGNTYKRKALPDYLKD